MDWLQYFQINERLSMDRKKVFKNATSKFEKELI